MKISNGSQDLAALSLKTVSARTASDFAAVKNFASVALNSQPLPPKDAGEAKKAALGNSDTVALNPQPLPPKDAGAAKKAAAFGNSDTVALNPQPLPPKDAGAAKKAAAFGNSDTVALNPQPLPPKEVSGGAAGRDDVTKAKIDSAKDTLKSDLDSMSEMGEMESLRLQMAMDRRSKMISTLSNALEKVSDTADEITANLK